MAAAEPLVKDGASIALPGLARALVAAGKLPAKTAEEIYQKSLSGRSSFIAELTGTLLARERLSVAAVGPSEKRVLKAVEPVRPELISAAAA